MLGSIFFGISAVGAFVLPETGLPLNVFLVNMGTFAGGVCFLVAAILLLPERVHETIKDPQVSSQSKNKILIKKKQICDADIKSRAKIFNTTMMDFPVLLCLLF